VAAITRHADRKQPIAASADFLTKRRIHDVEAAARFDWTRRLNRGTRETTGSVRRSIEAVTEGLEGQAPGLHLNPPPSPIAYSHPLIRGGARRHLLPRVGALTRAAERLHGSSFNTRSGNAQRKESQRRESRITRFQMSADKDGRVFVSGTKIHGKTVLRACSVNHRLRREDVDFLLAVVRQVGRGLIANAESGQARP
jgi:hypothetical protein